VEKLRTRERTALSWGGGVCSPYVYQSTRAHPHSRSLAAIAIIAFFFFVDAVRVGSALSNRVNSRALCVVVRVFYFPFFSILGFDLYVLKKLNKNSTIG
jgi:hypothetical protein